MKKSLCFLVFASVLCNGIAVSATNEDVVTVTEVIISENSEATPEFAETIEQNGIQYKLDDVFTSIVSENKKVVGANTQEFFVNGLMTAEYEWSPTQTITYEGVEYTATLIPESISYTESTESSERTEYVEATFALEGVVGEPRFDDIEVFEIQLENEIKQVELPLLRYEATSEEYVEEFHFPFYFYPYSADTYEIEGVIFEHNDEVCPLNENPDVILERLDYDKEIYTIQKVEWREDGWDIEGDMREATVYATRIVRDYVGYYGDDVVFGSSTNSWSGKATYMYEITETEYEIEGVASYVAIPVETTTAITTTTTTTSAETVTTTTATTTVVTTTTAKKEHNRRVNMKEVAATAGSGIVIVGVCCGVVFFQMREATAYNEEGKVVSFVRIGTKINCSSITRKTMQDFTIKLSATGAKKFERLKGVVLYAEDKELPYEYDENKKVLIVSNTLYR